VLVWQAEESVLYDKYLILLENGILTKFNKNRSILFTKRLCHKSLSTKRLKQLTITMHRRTIVKNYTIMSTIMTKQLARLCTSPLTVDCTYTLQTASKKYLDLAIDYTDQKWGPNCY